MCDSKKIENSDFTVTSPHKKWSDFPEKADKLRKNNEFALLRNISKQNDFFLFFKIVENPLAKTYKKLKTHKMWVSGLYRLFICSGYIS